MNKSRRVHVFLSRPTWVAPEFQKALDGFIGLLATLNLEPHTLGSTDYPVSGPLDEVIRLLERCEGAIILGYPQILVSKGTLKGKELEASLLLPTEWNHIEAALAYARELPLLVMHHRGVCRGVFDRGAVNKFLHEVDFTRHDWPLQQSTQGALKAWLAEMENRPARVINAGSAAKERRAKERTQLPEVASLPAEQLEILRLFGRLGNRNDGRLPLEAMAAQIGKNEMTTEYHLERLVERKLINVQYNMIHPTVWELNADGRRFLVENAIE
jgi:hypothetical protein